MKPFEEVSYGTIEQTLALGDLKAGVNNNNKKCSQKESASNLIAVITGAGEHDSLQEPRHTTPLFSSPLPLVNEYSYQICWAAEQNCCFVD